MDASRYETLTDYNLAHAAAPFPELGDERAALRGYTAAGAGLENDMGIWPVRCTIDFLPGGAPRPGERDRIGTVVASCWGRPPVVVLADEVSLRASWKLIRHHWPTRLSEAWDVLAPLWYGTPVWSARR